MILYGGIFTQPDAIELMARRGAQLATLMLAEYGIVLEVDPFLLELCLWAAKEEVATDYGDELTATLSYLAQEMVSDGIEPASF